jgi:hypothetical protein
MKDKNTKMVFDLAGTDKQDAEAYRTIAQALRTIADDRIDTGAAMGLGADFWVSIAGVEYFVTAKRSKKQRVQDGTEIKTQNVWDSQKDENP